MNVTGKAKKGKWRKWSINQRFLDNVKKAYPHRTFTNQQAYEIYRTKHARHDHADWDNTFRDMNARNTLCAAAYRGLLIRVGRGQYKFPKETK